jgi:hypothetical protein
MGIGIVVAVGCSDVEWVQKGYKNWKFLDPTSNFHKHAVSRMHQLSLERYHVYCDSNIKFSVPYMSNAVNKQNSLKASIKEAEKYENRESSPLSMQRTRYALLEACGSTRTRRQTRTRRVG